MNFRSSCPISSALDILGDRWTLIVLRNVFLGHHRYSEQIKCVEGIASNILSNRLALLEREHMISKTPYQHYPTRFEYRLTKKGADTLPILQELSKWSLKYVEDRWQPSEFFMKASPSDYISRPDPLDS